MEKKAKMNDDQITTQLGRQTGRRVEVEGKEGKCGREKQEPVQTEGKTLSKFQGRQTKV